jgi:predicted RNA binding protein YcfA (HicA-like mRNA interferase family)
MKWPRNISGDDLIKQLRKFGYHPTRQTGSHVRLMRNVEGKQQDITIRRHKSLKVGTLNNILREVAQQLKMSKKALLSPL